MSWRLDGTFAGALASRTVVFPLWSHGLFVERLPTGAPDEGGWATRCAWGLIVWRLSPGASRGVREAVHDDEEPG